MLASDSVPKIESLEQARQRPTLTALSAALHGYEGDIECVRVAIAAFRELPDGLLQYWEAEFGPKIEQKGRKTTLVEMILAILDVRGIEVGEATANRIRSCGDLSELERWAQRAREVDVATKLFTPT